MITSVGTQISDIFGDSVITNVEFKFEHPPLYVDQTTPVLLLTRFRNQHNFPVSNFDPGVFKRIYVFHNGYRLPYPLNMPYLGYLKFLVTPVETNVFLVKYEAFTFQQTVPAKMAWGYSKDFYATGTVCYALTNCWATLKNPIMPGEKLEFKCNRECYFGIYSDVGVICLCQDTKCLFTLSGNILKWSTTIAYGEYVIGCEASEVRLCVKLKKDRVVEVCSK